MSDVTMFVRFTVQQNKVVRITVSEGSNKPYYLKGKGLKPSGVRFDERGEVLEEDKALAEEILEGWDDFLLEHGVNSFELPRYLIDEDAKAAELAMADTRRSVFTVPLLSTGANLSAAAKAKILQYKDIVYGNKFLEDKALFYPADEPDWASESDAAAFIAQENAIEELWPGHHSMVPFFSTDNLAVKTSILKQYTDTFCVNQGAVVGSSQIIDTLTDGT